MSFHFSSSNYVGKYSITFLTAIIEFARDLQHNCKMLKFCNFKSKSLGGHNFLICDPIGILRLLANFYCIKDLTQHIIILICGHMAQNPLFWEAYIMCLMGDIQKKTHFLSCYLVHLDIGSIRIVIHVFLLSLLFPTLKSPPLKNLKT